MRPTVLACALLAASASAEEIRCPRAMQVRQVPIDTPQGWTATSGTSPVALSHVTFFDGKPEEEASLVYDRMTPGRTLQRAEWNFAPGSHIWMSCGYAGTTVVLSRELPGVSRCAVTYRRASQPGTLPPIEKIWCR